MNAVYLVALLAVIQFFVFGFLVGGARGKYGIKAPATTGNEGFERAFRAHMNTLEQLMGFLPALLICAQFWPPKYVAIVGVVYLIGRILYWYSYVTKPGNRSFGFLLTIAPTSLLMVGALIGLVRSFM
jgi:glutathione S-transferase